MNTLHTTRLAAPEAVLADDLIQGLARVVAVDDTRAWLITEPPAACSSCATRSACASGSPANPAAKASTRWCVPRTPGPGQTPWAPGDLVQVGVDRNALLRASLTAYALPLGFTLTAVVALQHAGNALAILGALTGLAVGVATARVLTRRWHHALVPVVMGRATATVGASCTPPSMARVPAHGALPASRVLRPVPLPVVTERRP